jgi:hypothetical protein
MDTQKCRDYFCAPKMQYLLWFEEVRRGNLVGDVEVIRKAEGPGLSLNLYPSKWIGRIEILFQKPNNGIVYTIHSSS